MSLNYSEMQSDLHLVSSADKNSLDFLNLLTLKHAAFNNHFKVNLQFNWLITVICWAESDDHDNILSAVITLVPAWWCHPLKTWPLQSHVASLRADFKVDFDFSTVDSSLTLGLGLQPFVSKWLHPNDGNDVINKEISAVDFFKSVQQHSGTLLR